MPPAPPAPMPALVQLYSDDGRRLLHQPALDGLRGVAVAVVVAFHLGFSVVSGGYLGVSLFFTLSGLLVGSLVIAALAHGGFSVTEFTARRARRLLPAALLTVAAVGLARVLFEEFSGTTAADVVTAALDVVNWRFVAADISYADLFASPSALLHFWSLAIEAQLYVVIAVVAVIAARRHDPRRFVLVVAALGAAASLALAPVMAAWRGWSIDRVYYGTDTRAGELLAGVVLAAVLAHRDVRHALLRRRRLVGVVAVAAAVASAALWVAASPTTAALRFGLLAVVTVLSSAIVVGALVPGPLQRLLEFAPLRHLGTISYALYLVHWPVIVVVDQIGVGRTAQRLIAIAIAVALAELLTAVVERPVRLRRVRRPALLGAGAAVAAVIAVTAVLPGRTSTGDDVLAAIVAADDAAAPPVIAEPAAADFTVAAFGDSIAFSLFYGIGLARDPLPAFEVPVIDLSIGCGVALSPWPNRDNPEECFGQPERYAAALAGTPLDAAVIVSCQWELLDQRLPGSDTVSAIGSAEFDAWVLDAYRRVAASVHDAGAARVLWLRCPEFGAVARGADVPAALVTARDPQRVARLNAIIDELALTTPTIDVLCFDGWVNARRDDLTIRPDGAHFDFEQANAAYDEFSRQLNSALAGGATCPA